MLCDQDFPRILSWPAWFRLTPAAPLLAYGRLNHSTPAIMLSTVRGTPTFRYSGKEIRTAWRARSTTIRLAMEPSSVRFPARVADMASVSHPRDGLARCAIRGLNSRTAGTLLTALDRTTAR